MATYKDKTTQAYDDYVKKQQQSGSKVLDKCAFMHYIGVPKDTPQATQVPGYGDLSKQVEFTNPTTGQKQYVYENRADEYAASSPEWQKGGLVSSTTKASLEPNQYGFSVLDGGKSVTPLPQVGTLTDTTTGTTTDTIAGTMVDLQKDQAIGALRRAFENTQGRLTQEGDMLEQTRRSEYGRLGTEDTMAREAADKQLATMGLSGAGAMGQADIAQSVITGGARSALSQQYSNAKADIQRRLTEAQTMMDQGIADATTQTELLKLEQQLLALEKAEAQALAQEGQAKADYLNTISRFYGNEQTEIDRILNDGDPSNDWQVPYLQAQQVQSGMAMEEQGMNQWLQTAKGQFFQDYDAEIQRLLASNDPMKDQKIAYLQGWRNEKIQSMGLDPTTGQPLQTGITYTVPQALEATRQGLWNQQIADALGLDFNTGQPRTGGISGGYTGTLGQTPITTTPIEQYAMFNQLAQEVGTGQTFLEGGAKPLTQRSPQEQINYMIQNEQELRSKYGDQLVDSLFEQLTTPQDTTSTQGDYLRFKSQVIPTGATIDVLLGAEQDIISNYDNYVNMYGEDNAEDLLESIYDAMADIDEPTTPTAKEQEQQVYNDLLDYISKTYKAPMQVVKFLEDNFLRFQQEGLSPSTINDLIEEYKKRTDDVDVPTFGFSK